MYYKKFVNFSLFLLDNYKFHLKWLLLGILNYYNYIRSFDVNKPGEKPENLKGGVVGGSIL